MRHDDYRDLISYVMLGNLLSQQKYTIESWVTGNSIPLWQGLPDSVWANLGVGNESRIVLKQRGSGKKWGILARAEISLPKEYKSVEEAPQLIYDYIDKHWFPLLKNIDSALTTIHK